MNKEKEICVLMLNSLEPLVLGFLSARFSRLGKTLAAMAFVV
jgi:hypothetical protein